MRFIIGCLSCGENKGKRKIPAQVYHRIQYANSCDKDKVDEDEDE